MSGASGGGVLQKAPLPWGAQGDRTRVLGTNQGRAGHHIGAADWRTGRGKNLQATDKGFDVSRPTAYLLGQPRL